MKKQIQQYYTFKFNSDRLKKFKYNIELDFDEALEYDEVISIFENQIIKSINRLKGRSICKSKINELKNKIYLLKKQKHSEENSKQIKEFQDEINQMLYVPEYITITMIHNSHYKYLYENGLTLNGIKYFRWNSSASQSRVNTVLFISEDVHADLTKVLDNGRNLNKKLVPAKLNAYRGLYGSSVYKVSTPKFCVVKDYHSDTDMKVNYVTETSWDEDDTVEYKEITKSFNRFDGQGLISPYQSKKWAEELGLDYTPAQWCIRGSFNKGMVCTFDIHRFCDTEIEDDNEEKYMIETIYKDENNEYIKVDIRNYDVILTESQMKLWDSWNSAEDYIRNCEENELDWGVTLFTPKKDKDFFFQNYQFLQVLNLTDRDIEELCSKFVNWVTGVTSENVYYAMLFLLGLETTEDKFMEYIEESDNYWVKSLIIAPEIINEKYIKRKLYDLIKRKIKNGCLGQIITSGNFQVIVSDPYAMMEHVCGKTPKGLLGKGEYYSNYWNKKGINEVVASRSPLTYRSEHVILDLKDSKKMNDWYEYCYTGIILNIHGDETVRFAGSDFDYDILATTCEKSFIRGVYKDELPVVYQEPVADKEIVTNDMLYNADLFSFNSLIGSLTNKSTTGYALLETFNKDSDEYKTILNRIKGITKGQSAQIDKTKIGKPVKGIVSKWVNYQKINEDDSEEIKKKKEFENSIMLDKHPYFFTYLYKGTRNKYKKHLKEFNISSMQKFGMTLHDLIKLDRKTQEQHEFLKTYEKYLPVINSDCTMNRICRYIESIDFGIKNILKNSKDDYYELYMSGNIKFDNKKYNKIKKVYEEYKESINTIMSTKNFSKSKFDEEIKRSLNNQEILFKNKLNKICSNIYEVTDYLVHLFYVDMKSENKDILWRTYGEYMFENIKSKKDSCFIPIEDENGEIEYLTKKYSLRKVWLND